MPVHPMYDGPERGERSGQQEAAAQALAVQQERDMAVAGAADAFAHLCAAATDFLQRLAPEESGDAPDDARTRANDAAKAIADLAKPRRGDDTVEQP